MPKLKTKKAVKKRFKISSTGKILKNAPNRRHLLGDKDAGKKRKLRKQVLLDPTDVKRIKECLPYG